MAGPLLSAVLIVRDEERFLPDCLASIEGVADEIVVLDTGSTDATVRVAEGAGARVFHAAWTDDFSAARNAAVDHARGDWILWIDADERISAGGEDLAALLAQPRFVGATVLLRPRPGATRYRELRLFRNHPRLRFSGQIHEDVWTATCRLAHDEGRWIVDTDLAVDHLGYEGDQESKHRRNLPLLRARLAREPDNTFCLHHLGVVLAALGDPDGAVEAWERTIAVARTRQVAELDGTVDAPAGDWLPYEDLLLHHGRTGGPVEELLARAEARFPNLPPLRSMRADLYMANGDHVAAAEDLEALVALDPDEVVHPVSFDQRLCGDLSWARLGICRFQTGAFAEAVEAFEMADRLHPSTEYRARLAVARARAGRSTRPLRATC